ncbi:uncharacterized protein LTHEOB_624 [Lasiodiplodia theobromae]|uniref:uncharacterized protein n=1 Tax=Lasiodiplodia theobromae TaxID=45133 RepID=UPI0015C2F5DA|nr:uncharacterized protein LTHEOB_624 [Lasiodiplodia theobromae]KAF4540682.1 hypothetical protein LTHEOB_624 [Lasiodiplodia theobromae]
MYKQSIPPEEGELDIERYMDTVVRKNLVALDNSATYQDQRAVMTVKKRASDQTSDYLAAVGDRADICERIAETFNRVQEFQIKVERHMTLYSESPEMRFCATETYISFLAMIQSMISTLVDIPTHKKIKDSLLKHRKRSSSYAGLDENEEEFYRQIQCLDDVAEHLHKETLVGVKEGMRSVDSGLQRTRRMIVGMFRQNEDSLKTVVRGIQDSEGKIINAVDARGVVLFDSLKDFITQHVKVIIYQSSEGQQAQKKTSTTGSWVRGRLLKALGADLMPPEQEDNSAKKMVVILEKPFHSRVHALLRSDRFKDFLSSRESAFLPIVSPWEDYATESFTPMSIISRALTECVAPLTDKRVISFYCGFHTSRDDGFFGPIGLMKSLTIQLLRSDLFGSFDFNSVNEPAFRERLEAGDVHHLCELFKALVNKIPEQSILFCVIDGLSLFQAIEPELTSFTISALENTVQTMGWHAAFKVLTTTCGLEQMSSFQPLYLSEEVYESDDGGDLEGVADPEFDLMGEQGQLTAYKNATGTFILPEGYE